MPSGKPTLVSDCFYIWSGLIKGACAFSCLSEEETGAVKKSSLL
ncbi:hypothetical protein SAMD00020551_4573 [Mesobacillus selenatarsenatis SF-1]|uniref:Uncharacterized protein n=1 Tax=Mesobacillus selenatarsenatis (strain DSM 18680 / JCM 14380 / FERM P-15431 / SF-1) TaxID=1321606 RepID=A0A0A8X8Z3_MESS1|nr:hypothetical protein SAMD00020551_4573 [Mesobacillus selenatarsenatis SF-1]